MSIWPHEPISSLGTVITGSTPLTSNESFYRGEIPFVTPAELDRVEPVTAAAKTLSDAGAQEVRRLPEGAVMVCCIGSLGKIGIAGREVATNQQDISPVLAASLRAVHEFARIYLTLCTFPTETCANWAIALRESTLSASVNVDKAFSLPPSRLFNNA